MMALGATRVTVDEAVALGASTVVVVTVSVVPLAGAVYVCATPEAVGPAEMLPDVADQVTVADAPPVTVGVNAWVPPWTMVMAVGARATEAGVLTVTVALAVLPEKVLVAVTVQVPAVVAVKRPVVALIVPPVPVTDQVTP